MRPNSRDISTSFRQRKLTVELEDGHFAKVHVGVDLKALITEVPGVAAVTVDMPLGLVKQVFDERRELLARSWPA